MAPLVNAARLRAFFLPERGALLPRPYMVVAIAGVALGTLLAITPAAQGVEWSVYDLYSLRQVRGADPAPGIVVVAIDEPSFTEIGLPWPWPRSLHATLVEKLAAAGAKTIAFDVLFDAAARDADDDQQFAAALRQAGNVILATDQAAIADRAYSLTQWTDPTQVLSEAAAALGAVRIPFDPDGVLRRAALSIDGRPTLAMTIAARDGVGVPAGAEMPRLFRFDGEPRRGIVTVSYYQALDAEHLLPADLFRNQRVLVGRSLAATPIDQQADFFRTPVAVTMAGVEVHATIVDALLRNRFIRDPFAARPAVVALCVAVGLVMAAVFFRLGPTMAILTTLSSIAVLFAAGYLARGQGLRVPVVAPSLSIAMVYAVTAAYRYGLTAHERRLIKRAFQHYVAPAIVEKMLNDPSRLKLGGEEYEVTVLFSDLEGFTTMSERLTPHELSAHLSGYFKSMLDVLIAEHGTLDKLIGDAIMMYFGCPVPEPGHAAQACRGALAMQRRMQDLNARWAAEGMPQLRTRVGINTGRAVAGNMGTDTIFNYTILGDCVNLASRLEGTNKEYGTLIILGEDTWQQVRDEFETRELDWIRVKGKHQPVAIYELVAEAGQIDERRRSLFARFAEGLGHYRAGDWSEAARAFDAALDIDPDDGPSRTFQARCRYYFAHVPEAWDGVHVMHSK